MEQQFQFNAHNAHQSGCELGQIAHDVRRIYNYQVGQKAGVGVVVLVAGLLAGGAYFFALMVGMMSQIFEGLRQTGGH